jgi:hypothetical protein
VDLLRWDPTRTHDPSTPINSGTCTMSAWAYRCHPCVEDESDWFVSQLDVEQLGPDVRIVRVRVGRDWRCAFLDRTQPVVVDSQLLRDVIPSDDADCPQCSDSLAAARSTPIAAVAQRTPSAGSTNDSSDSRPRCRHSCNSVSGGMQNEAGVLSSVSDGHHNEAQGAASSVSGGFRNVATEGGSHPNTHPYGGVSAAIRNPY